MYLKVSPVKQQDLARIIKDAGKILIGYFGTSFGIQEKAPLHVVTDADVASERFLVAELLKLIPGAAIYSEEFASRPGNNDYCWIIDPLDGTNNFVHGIGYFCISIALAYNGTVVQCAIYQPLSDELFYAERGRGAFLNGVAIAVPSHIGLPMLSFAYLETINYHRLVDKIPFRYLFRHLGAAALDLAYVACGRLDAMISQKLSWWDLAAGGLLVQEAGGIVADFAGQQVEKDSTSCIAINPQLYPQLAEILAKQV